MPQTTYTGRIRRTGGVNYILVPLEELILNGLKDGDKVVVTLVYDKKTSP